RGSLGFDLATTVDTTLTDSTVHKIPSDAVGPLIHPDSSVGGQLVGRSSAGAKGLIVLPGVINADYTGHIYIMAYTVCPPLFVPKSSCIAQIIAIDNLFCDLPESTVYRRDQGFGSSGPAVCFTTTMSHQSMVTIVMSQGNSSKHIVVMLDTGADVTIIS
ncbi:POK9 protein, partial [Ibidorhyncha struthersii]|nr:POK9 protein [Ibidorhyncha struthersii]